MHAMWERMALILTILGPAVALLFHIGFMAVVGDFSFGGRVGYFGKIPNAEPVPVIH
jgi:cytochrome c oxidase subunit IV